MAEPNVTTPAHIRDLEILRALITEPEARKNADALLARRRRECEAYHAQRVATGRLGGRPRKKVTFPSRKKVTFPVEKVTFPEAVSRSLDLSTKILSTSERERVPARAREEARPPTQYPPAWQGRRLDVPLWLDAILRKELNGHADRRFAIYQTLDERLVSTGERYDSRWIREHVAELAPPVERLETPAASTVVRTDAGAAIHWRERSKALEYLRRYRAAHASGCPHDSTCSSESVCIANLVGLWREEERSTLAAWSTS